MPNLKSSIKRMKTSREKHEQNKAEKSALKTIIKKILTSVDEQKTDEAVTMLKTAFSAIDRAAKKNIIHKNNAARKKSLLSTKVNKITATK